jgi:hypothetical protein
MGTYMYEEEIIRIKMDWQSYRPLNDAGASRQVVTGSGDTWN